jgi:ParB/RepB/Spo0J family partition protein
VSRELKLPLDRIRLLPQIRQFSWGDIEELSRIIRATGWISPVLVVRLDASEAGEDEATHRLVAGERRYRAAKLLCLPTIPATEIDGRRDWQLQLGENLGRAELHWIELARKLHAWCDDGIDLEKLAETMGSTIPHVRRLIRAYRGLQPENLKLLLDGRYRPPLEKGLVWAQYTDPDLQRKEIEKWLGLAPEKKTKAPTNEHRRSIPVERVRALLVRATARRASRTTLAALRYLLGETRRDPFRAPRKPPTPSPEPSPTPSPRPKKRPPRVI